MEYSIHGKLTDPNNTPVIVNPYCADYLILRDQQQQQKVQNNNDQKYQSIKLKHVI